LEVLLDEFNGQHASNRRFLREVNRYNFDLAGFKTYLEDRVDDADEVKRILAQAAQCWGQLQKLELRMDVLRLVGTIEGFDPAGNIKTLTQMAKDEAREWLPYAQAVSKAQSVLDGLPDELKDKLKGETSGH
jgi:hypothetical protein